MPMRPMCNTLGCINSAVEGAIYCQEHKADHTPYAVDAFRGNRVVYGPGTEPFRYADPLLNERGKTHGNSVGQFTTAQAIKATLRCSTPNWGRSDIARHPNTLTSQMQEALEMIATKMSRICHGDPTHIDAWDDIAGYAKLVAETLRQGD